jgi:alkanesulfonate monooxygenase SsuD/methylene tetrahydromethanopterin reductase-like flavin-dependent oxidoreductase (luciferase family)
MFTTRFDMRTPDSGGPTPSLYAAALDMCAWAETRGAVMAVLSEHHATADGHLPSPLILASAIAARTKVLNILVAAAVLPLYHPVRLAEDIAVLDNLSKGRVHYVFGIGHRPEAATDCSADCRRSEPRLLTRSNGWRRSLTKPPPSATPPIPRAAHG